MESLGTAPIITSFFEHFFGQGANAEPGRVDPGASAAGAGLPQALQTALAQNQVVLTPNDRLATRLSQAYVAWSAQAGHAVCAVPTFSSLTRWAQAQWDLLRGYVPASHALAGRTHVLTAQAEWVLWENLVANTDRLSLLDMGGLARLAQEAYAIERAWCMKPQEIQAHAQGDQRYYVQWRSAFIEACAAQAVLPRADVLAALMAVPAGVAAPIQRCCWLGFSALTPREEALFNAMDAIWSVTPTRSSLRDFLPPLPGSGEGTTYSCRAEDEADELQRAIRWLGDRFSPEAKLALVVPDLPTRKTDLERAFQTQWAPAWAPQALLTLPDANVTDTPLAEWVSFSGGTALADLPLYAPVRTLAAMARGQVTLEQVTVLLTNPYLGTDATERGRRQQLLQALQAQQLTHWPLTEALAAWRSAGLTKMLDACADWVGRFEQCVHAFSLGVGAGPESVQEPEMGLTPAVLDSVLEIWGWPGAVALDSAEYQQLKKWGGVRYQWAEMLRFRQQVAFGVPAARADLYLQEILANQIFQPKSQDTPVQVLGILEALEQPFDALWFMGADDQVLPPAARPHPLLPQSLQRHYNSLRATPGRELALAQETVQAFTALTRETCFSWPARAGSRECAPSRLIAHLPLMAPEDGATEADKSGFALTPLPLEQCTETHAPPVPQPDQIKGGTGIMKTFAECPFKALVRYRLGIQPPSVPTLGLDAVVRGVLVHALLESIWRTLGAHSALVALSESERFELVSSHVEKVLSQFTAPAGLYLGHVLFIVEAQRLQRVALQWLAFEAKRAPFRVKGVEQALTVTLAGLQLDIRLDRIDQTPAGEVLVIDYKTGHTDVGQWFGRRIQAPQLPLYCTALGPEAKGVFYGVVKASKPQLKGAVAEGVLVMADSKDSRSIRENAEWPSVVEVWRKTLSQSAADFMAGLAVVDPIEGTRTCERCHYASVCRIQSRVQAFAGVQSEMDEAALEPE